MRRFKQLLVAGLAIPAVLVQTAHPQTRETAGRIEVGGTLGLAFVGISGAQTIACSTNSTGQVLTLGLRGAIGLNGWLVLEATLEVDQPPVNTIACPPPQVRRTGPDTLVLDIPQRTDRLYGKVTTTTARMSVVPWSTSWAEVRVYGGVGRIWALHAFPVIAGLNGRVKLGAFHVIGEVEIARYVVALTHFVGFYQDGNFTSAQETPSRKQRLDATVRLGIALRF